MQGQHGFQKEKECIDLIRKQTRPSPFKLFLIISLLILGGQNVLPVNLVSAEAVKDSNSLPLAAATDYLHTLYLPTIISDNTIDTNVASATVSNFLYGVVDPAGMVAGSAAFESSIREWQRRGFDSALIMNNVPDLSVSDRLNFKIIASPVYNLYRQWFYYEKYQNGAALCNNSVTIDCARRIIGPTVDSLKTHPSVKGYYIIDDATIQLKERIRLANQVFKERDLVNPSSPGLLQLKEGQTVYEHARPNAFATYFYPAWKAYPACYFYTDQARDWVDRIRETTQAKPASVPLWTILQAHSTVDRLRTPTVEEMRLLNWLALGEDAKGIFWFTWSTVQGESWTGIKDNPALLAELTDLARRVNTLRPILSSTRKIADKFQITPSGNAYVSTLKDLSTGKLYVIAANNSCSPQNLTISSWFYNGSLKNLETGAISNLGTTLNFRGGDGKIFEVLSPTAKTPPALQPNLVTNPSFETDTNRDGKPDNWTVATSAVTDSTVKRSGNVSLKVTGPSATVTLQNVTLKPNTKYYVSWYMKGASLVESRLGIQVFETSPVKTYLDSVLWDQNGSYEWVKRVGFFKTPADYSSGQIIVGWNVKSGSTYWVDDITLCEAAKPCADSYLKERQ